MVDHENDDMTRLLLFQKVESNGVPFFKVLKRVFWTFSYLYLYGVQCDFMQKSCWNYSNFENILGTLLKTTLRIFFASDFRWQKGLFFLQHLLRPSHMWFWVLAYFFWLLAYFWFWLLQIVCQAPSMSTESDGHKCSDLRRAPLSSRQQTIIKILIFSFWYFFTMKYW